MFEMFEWLVKNHLKIWVIAGIVFILTQVYAVVRLEFALADNCVAEVTQNRRIWELEVVYDGSDFKKHSAKVLVRKLERLMPLGLALRIDSGVLKKELIKR